MDNSLYCSFCFVVFVMICGRILAQDEGIEKTATQNGGGPTDGQYDPKSGDVSASAKQNTRHLKFTDDWSSEFPKCSPGNAFGSPIDLNTSKVIHVKKHLRTLMLYSFEPIKTYFLQTWYNDTENNIVMSALTITLLDSIFFEATYINGLGFNEFQLFQRAVFFMSKSPLAPAQSHHRINGTRFPMELMLTFTNRLPDNGTIRNTTQIFIMIKIQKDDNPNYFPVIDAAKKILKMKSKSQQLKNLTETLAALTKNLTKLTQQYSQSGRGGSVEVLEPVIGNVKLALKKLLKNERMRQGLEYITGVTKKELEIENYKPQLVNLTSEFDSWKTKYETLTSRVKSNPNDLELLDDKAENDEQMNLYQKRLTSLRKVVGAVSQKLRFYDSTVQRSIEEDRQLNSTIQSITSQITGDEKVESGSQLLNFYEKQFKLWKQIKELQKKVNETSAELDKTKDAKGWKQKLDTFQVTWLFPDGGGVYFYNGSSPLPPCHRFRTTIVLEQPVGISQAQYNTLAAISAYEGYEQVADRVAPKLAQRGNRPVWFNSKTIQWMRDDGVHMKSIVRKKWKDEMREEWTTSGAAAVSVDGKSKINRKKLIISNILLVTVLIITESLIIQWTLLWNFSRTRNTLRTLSQIAAEALDQLAQS